MNDIIERLDAWNGRADHEGCVYVPIELLTDAREALFRLTALIPLEEASEAIGMMTPTERLILDGLSILMRTQYMPGKFDSPETATHIAKLTSDMQLWEREYAALSSHETKEDGQ
jgi:hypothetical protein